MKILLVSGIYPPDIGGPSTFIPGFHQYLITKKAQVRVVTLTDDLISSKQKYPDIKFISRDYGFPKRQFFTMWSILRNSVGVDSIFSNGLFEETALMALILRKEVVFKIVGDPVWERFRNRTGSKMTIEEFNVLKGDFRTKFQRFLLRISLNCGNQICTPSNQLAVLIKKWGVTTPVTVIPNGVTRINIENSAQAVYDVVTVSRLVSWKNIDLIISACALKNLNLAVVGDGPERLALEKHAQTKGANVTFLGSLEGDELQQIMSVSKVFCLYSDYEGLSFALISALMRGMLVVVSDIPGNRNAVKNGFNGVLVPLNSVDILSTELAEEKQNLEVSNSMRRNAREHALENFLDVNCYERTIKLMVNNEQ